MNSSPRLSVLPSSTLSTKMSRRLRTCSSACPMRICRLSCPPMPWRSNIWRRSKSSATWISALEGMQPTRAQVVPSSPPLMMTKLSVPRRTLERANRPAEPVPMMATSTLRSVTGSTLVVSVAGECQSPRQLRYRPRTPRPMKQNSTHAGMLKPNRRQVTSAHSPEPVKTIFSVLLSGNTRSM